MPNNKSLTKLELIATLKQMDFATKNDLKNFATKNDLKSLATKDDIKNMATKDDILASERKLRSELASKDDVLASERRLKLRMGKMKNELAIRIVKLAVDTPTSKEFEDLKRKVEGNYTS
ncbi:hypothetical protein A2714_02145 [Candidatus Woesebacteria bacterium RIFCSPHIGHO2_01_FULL_38_9]|uniref:Uncharacterized protein n=2 Tax=Candidatus Woeseibacteriota TaxID=1752722 RepID=A0A1F7Y2U5_9BACT|nr:MAG: hypothetical protein A2714_02145 [Candidatus Woesebacteria bacterium RIFCSPHIGHO2_01_FULL_38_9]